MEAVHVWYRPFATGYPVLAEANVGLLEAEAEALLEGAVGAVDTTGVTVERTAVTGSAAHALVEQAKGATLLVVGSRGRGGFAGLLLGSVGQQAAHHAPCPIVIIPTGS